jgi:uncharacterized membrane protein
MSETSHKLFIGLLVFIVMFTMIGLTYKGISYYSTSIEERFYHPDNSLLKPSGTLGHGFGIVGSLLIIIGVSTYMARKRYRFLSRLGVLKHWLEFHIFLCTLGPVLVLFHTAYKFGGLVAVSFWSMVAVFLSGIAGRFIYLQIPRTIEGQELSQNDIRAMKTDIAVVLMGSYHLDQESYSLITDTIKKKVELYQSNIFVRFFINYSDDRKTIRRVREVLRKSLILRNEKKQIVNLIKTDLKLNRKIERLSTMQNLFKYWHVVHSPFALVMLIIMIIHVGVTIAFGYRWIF